MISRSRMLRALLIAATLALAGATPTPALAENPALAKKLFKQAQKRFAARDYRRALALYQRALAAKALPGFHLNIGQCYRKLRNCSKAVEHYRLYLAQTTSAKHREDVEKLIEACDKELGKGTLPDPTPPAAPVREVEEQPPLVRRPALRPEPEPAPPPTSRRRLGPAYFWTGVAVTAALLATGTVTGALALTKSSRFRDLSTPGFELRELKDTGETLKLTSTITFSVGAAAAVTTTILLFFTDFGAKETKVAAGPTTGGAMVVVGGEF